MGAITGGIAGGIVLVMLVVVMFVVRRRALAKGAGASAATEALSLRNVGIYAGGFVGVAAPSLTAADNAPLKSLVEK
jgi:hypothetical protein